MRRLSFLMLALAMAACTKDPPTVTPVPPTVEGGAAATSVPGAKPMRAQVLNTELGTGFERIAFRLFDDTGVEIKDGDVRVAFVTTDPKTGGRKELASGPSLFFGELLPSGGSWVAYTDFDASGPWNMEVTASKPGWSGAANVTATVVGRTRAPRVGPPPPAQNTPKLAAGADLSSITSAQNADPEMYRMTVAEAIASKKPTVVVFGSEAHCPTPVCRATLTEVKAVMTDARYKGKVNFIAVESHDLKNPSELSASAKAWGLPSEPWTFVLNRNGGVSVRVEGGLERSELSLLLDRELQAGKG